MEILSEKIRVVICKKIAMENRIITLSVIARAHAHNDLTNCFTISRLLRRFAPRNDNKQKSQKV